MDRFNESHGMKELYERFEGTITPEGVVCGYNEKKEYIIVEAKKGWERKSSGDVIFSNAKKFLYIRSQNIISLGFSHPEIENEWLKEIEAIFTYGNNSLFQFLEQDNYSEYNNTPEIFYSKMSKSEIFLNELEKKIKDYKLKKFENLIRDNELKFYKNNKKYENENIRKFCSKKSKWTTCSIGILLLFFCFIVFIEARDSISFWDICFIVLMIGIVGFIFYFIFNKLLWHLYQLIHKKNIKRFNKLHKLDKDIIEENNIVIRVIDYSLLRIEKYRQNLVNRTEKFTEDQQTKELLKIRAEEEERQREIFRKKVKYWLDMDGYSFEDEVSILFLKKGYKVTRTPYSGDGGIDLIVHDENGKMGIVQCKNFTKQVSPSVARDLFGTKHAMNADFCILVCSGGFTSGTIKFAEENNIQLIDVHGLIKMTY